MKRLARKRYCFEEMLFWPVVPLVDYPGVCMWNGGVHTLFVIKFHHE
jgi:hypothetical protein